MQQEYHANWIQRIISLSRLNASYINAFVSVIENIWLT